MLSEFPKFNKIELLDKEDIEKITKKYPPYSDFNFVSMWSWDVGGEMRISVLNDNLVVRFTDYLTGFSFYSFLGSNKVDETIKKIISFSKEKYNRDFLKLIPAETIDNIVKDDFDLKPEEDAYDYIFSISHLSNMNKWPKHSSSKNIKSFFKSYPNYIIKDNYIKDLDKSEYLKMFEKWADNKGLDNGFELNEYKALERIFQMKQDNLKVISLYVNNALVGFAIHEILSIDYAISHFAKADMKCHRGTNDILNWAEAKILDSLGIKYFNWEQDLGIMGLKKAKEKYSPAFYLKKFIVSLK
jgi:uncharacterized protein